MLIVGLYILDNERSKLSPGFSKTQTCFLCDLQPSFNSPGAQNALWIIHDPKQCALSTHSTSRASQVLLAAPVGKNSVTPVQGEALRILRYENLCPVRTEEYLYHSVKQVAGCGALAGQC